MMFATAFCVTVAGGAEVVSCTVVTWLVGIVVAASVVLATVVLWFAIIVVSP